MYFYNDDFGKQTILLLTGFAAVSSGKGNSQLILSGRKEESTISALWIISLKSGILNQAAFIILREVSVELNHFKFLGIVLNGHGTVKGNGFFFYDKVIEKGFIFHKLQICCLLGLTTAE